jgi:hypothetical protein
MSSRTVALALAAMVLLSGCSMFGGGGGDDAPETTVAEAPDHHELVFGSNTNGHPFEATVNVSKNGTVLHEQTIASDGTGKYQNMTTFEEPGPYTVTVNTTLPGVGGGNRSERFTIDGELGHATLVSVAYQGIYDQSFSLPRRSAPHSLGAHSGYINYDDDPSSELQVRLWYRNELVGGETVSIVDNGNFKRILELEKTGVYRVSARGQDGEWMNQTLVVSSPKQVIKVRVGVNGNMDKMRVLRVELV